MRAAVVAAAAAAAAPPGPRPDVLFLAVDDLRPELGCYGCGYMHTPNIDALSKGSLVFDSMYVQYSLCSPSRTVFLTSRRPDTSRVYGQDFFRLTGGNFTTLPQHFRESGYLALGTGKIFHPVSYRYPDIEYDTNYSWSPEALPYVDEYDNPDGTGLYDYGHGACSEWNASAGEMGEGKLAAHAAGLLDLVAGKRQGGDKRPFFLAVGFHRPHIAWQAPREFFEMYDPDLPLATRLHLPVDMPNLASSGAWKGYWRNFSDLAKVTVSDGFPYDNTTLPEDTQRRIRQAYRAAISFTDRNVGVVLSKLRALGWYDSTLITFLGDHGYQLGENNQWGKTTNFEHSNRIPWMMRLPASAHPSFAPGRSSALVEEVDIYPTLVELALGEQLPLCPDGPDAARGVGICTEGRSFVPLLAAPAAEWKSAAFWQFARGGGVMGYSIRVAGWRYTEWVQFDAATSAPDWSRPAASAELYPHAAAPDLSCEWDYEHANLVADPVHAQVRDELSRRLHAGWRGALPPGDE